jgi:hypothetical protein
VRYSFLGFKVSFAHILIEALKGTEKFLKVQSAVIAEKIVH